MKLRFETEFKDPDDYSREYDLVIGADGDNSLTRTKYVEHFNPRIDVRKCRFIWLGTRKKLNAFTFAFKQTGAGWFNLHAYQFNEEWATFILETPEETWLKAGIDKMDPDQSTAFCEELFAVMLDGARLISNARHLRGSAVWLKFNRVLCERWFKDNIGLLGERRPHRAFLHRFRHQAGDGGCRGAGQGAEQHRLRRSGASGPLPGGTRNRGTQAAKCRAQPHDRLISHILRISLILADERGQSSIDPAFVNTATILLRLEAAKPLSCPCPNPAWIATRDHVDKLTRHTPRSRWRVSSWSGSRYWCRYHCHYR